MALHLAVAVVLLAGAPLPSDADGGAAPVEAGPASAVQESGLTPPPLTQVGGEGGNYEEATRRATEVGALGAEGPGQQVGGEYAPPRTFRPARIWAGAGLGVLVGGSMMLLGGLLSNLWSTGSAIFDLLPLGLGFLLPIASVPVMGFTMSGLHRGMGGASHRGWVVLGACLGGTLGLATGLGLSAIVHAAVPAQQLANWGGTRPTFSRGLMPNWGALELVTIGIPVVLSAALGGALMGEWGHHRGVKGISVTPQVALHQGGVSMGLRGTF